MNFYLDFEATQYSQEIISIGCVTDKGDAFSTLVKPHKTSKITNFITKLTGITQEMLVDAPDADTAFNIFFDWVIKVSDETRPTYFCYGDADTQFIAHTMKHMKDMRAISYAASICALLVDYAPLVSKYFNTNRIALKKVIAFIENVESVQQKHDAVEDAQMLCKIVNELQIPCDKDDVQHVATLQPTSKSKRAPDVFISWSLKAKFEADTLADETNYHIKCCRITDKKVKYFNSVNTAALWMIKYFHQGMSPKKHEDVRKVENNIKTAITNKMNGQRYGQFIWEQK